MLSDSEVIGAAKDLAEAEKSRTQIGLLSQKHPHMDMDDAYAIQAALVRHKIEAGRKIIGWKIGLTSKAMQNALNIDVPDSGVLFDDMLFENGADIPQGRFIQPRVEAELAFVMKNGLKGAVSIDDVLRATDYVCPALEILDTRIVRADPATKKARNICDTISDNAANAGIVLGDVRLDPYQTDLRWIGAIVSRDDEVEETGLGAGVLNHPARGIAWLSERLAHYDGQIQPGQIVLAGSFIRPIETTSGAKIRADFGAYGEVSCRFL